MNTSASSQLEAIQEMMASGHRSVTMERHTLVLWGVAAAALILFVDAFFTQERFPEVALRSIYAHAFVIIPLLLLVGLVDFRMTRAARRKRDESISFVQMQVTKIWWMLIGLIVLINFGMNFFGGGFLFYGVTLAIMGVAFFVNGLFSQQMLSWVGSLLILLGLSMVMFQVPYALQEWIAVGVFGLGFPALALVMKKEAIQKSSARRIFFAFAWLVVALLPAHIVYYMENKSAALDVAAVDLATYLNQEKVSAGIQVVTLPAGTKVPVQLQFTGNILTTDGTEVITLTLQQPVQLAIKDGELDGRFNLAERGWKDSLYGMIARANTVKASITPGQGPRIEMNAQMFVKE